MGEGRQQQALTLTGWVQCIDWIVEGNLTSYVAKILGIVPDNKKETVPYLREEVK